MASETSSQQTRYDPWISQQQQGTAGTAYGLANNFWQASPFARAAQTADQLKAFDLARISTGNVFDAAPVTAPSGVASFNPTDASAAQIGPGAISQFMNPYAKAVGDTTLDAMRREYMNTDANLASKYAAGSMMGGSGEAIARGQAARGYGQNVASTIAGIQGGAYDKALGAAGQNAQMEQQANMANAANRNSMTLAQADYNLKIPQVESQLRSQQQARELQGAQAVLGAGNQQQQFAQSAMDVPRTMLDWYRNYVPQVYNQDVFKQTEKDDGGSGLLNGVLGLGSSLIGAAGKAGGFGALLGLSDETMKTDITKLGKDPETGEMMYAYRYKDDPKTYPKVVGPMAQELEHNNPGTTRKIGGKMVVDVGLLSDALRSAKKAA